MATADLAIRSCVVGTLSCQKDSYLRTLDTQVLSCVPYVAAREDRTTPPKKDIKKQGSMVKKAKDEAVNDPSWLIEFKDSVLFPEGGGQPTDYGTLTPLEGNDATSIPTIDVNFVERQGLKCVVHSPRPLSPGTSVRQSIDFARRYDLMQQHTGQHLLSAIMNTYENLNTLGWGMGAEGEMSYVDLPRKLTDDEVQSIQHKVNEAIQQNIPITVEVSDQANTSKLPDDYDKDQGAIRVIKIGDLDNNTCCGTHLRQTSHISLLLLGSNEKASSNRHRQYFIAGNRAITLASKTLSSTRTIAKLLSSTPTPDEVTSTVTKLASQVATLKRNEGKLLAEIAGYEAQRVRGELNDGQKRVFVHRPEPGMEFINLVAASVKDDIARGDGGVAIILASGEGSSSGAVLIVGDQNGVDATVTQVKALFPGIKGGGKGERWQGKMAEWKNGDVERLRSLT